MELLSEDKGQLRGNSDRLLMVKADVCEPSLKIDEHNPKTGLSLNCIDTSFKFAVNSGKNDVVPDITIISSYTFRIVGKL